MKKLNLKIVIACCILLIILIVILVSKYMSGFIFGEDSDKAYNLKNYTHIISNINKHKFYVALLYNMAFFY